MVVTILKLSNTGLNLDMLRLETIGNETNVNDNIIDSMEYVSTRITWYLGSIGDEENKDVALLQINRSVDSFI